MCLKIFLFKSSVFMDYIKYILLFLLLNNVFKIVNGTRGIILPVSTTNSNENNLRCVALTLVANRWWWWLTKGIFIERIKLNYSNTHKHTLQLKINEAEVLNINREKSPVSNDLVLWYTMFYCAQNDGFISRGCKTTMTERYPIWLPNTCHFRALIIVRSCMQWTCTAIKTLINP